MHTYTRFLLGIFSAFPLICCAQADTIYYDQNGRKADFDNADYYRVIELKQDKRYKVEEHYLNNKLKMTGYYSFLDANFANFNNIPSLEVSDGPFIYYDEKGNKKSEGNVEKNNLTGEWKYYYEASNDIWHIDQYKDGKRDGELTSYYKDGKVKRRELQLNGNAITGKCYDEQGNEMKFTQFETMAIATFNLSDFLSNNLKYPLIARKKNIEGRVIVKFAVNKDGSISDVKATKKIGGGCDEEAVRVVLAMPKWKPATRDDKKVKTSFTLPVVFKLTD